MNRKKLYFAKKRQNKLARIKELEQSNYHFINMLRNDIAYREDKLERALDRARHLFIEKQKAIYRSTFKHIPERALIYMYENEKKNNEQ